MHKSLILQETASNLRLLQVLTEDYYPQFIILFLFVQLVLVLLQFASEKLWYFSPITIFD
ncbi:MAG: hypothetical protein A2465_01600 [Bacteroidetes bacterium RIFOXYC2_FULL_39_11]|nr:MAG: hypothetical protein A2465_01600 [Bacteroidetes bacterium RIFOXYC2_FULL_39_11]